MRSIDFPSYLGLPSPEFRRLLYGSLMDHYKNKITKKKMRQYRIIKRYITGGGSVYNPQDVGMCELRPREGCIHCSNYANRSMCINPEKLIRLGADWIEEIKPKQWRAENGETYFSINMGSDIESDTEDGTEYDDMAYESGNYFESEESAEAVRIKVLELIKDESDKLTVMGLE